MAVSSEKEMPFLDHLEELRRRLFWMIGALAVGLVIGLYFSFGVPGLIDFLTEPISTLLPPTTDGTPGRLVAVSPTGPFRFHTIVALYIAVIFAIPVILYQVWAFLAPGLYMDERKVVIPVLVGGALLFILGALVGFKVALPMTLRFLLKVAQTNFELMITVEHYFKLLVTLTLTFGIMFELPIVILALTALGVVTPQFLSKYRRHAIVILMCICAVLTPPEPMTLLIMFTPVYLLYELSVLLSYLLHRKQERDAALGKPVGEA